MNLSESCFYTAIILVKSAVLLLKFEATQVTIGREVEA